MRRTSCAQQYLPSGWCRQQAVQEVTMLHRSMQINAPEGVDQELVILLNVHL